MCVTVRASQAPFFFDATIDLGSMNKVLGLNIKEV
jgi:hypothetical protein